MIPEPQPFFDSCLPQGISVFERLIAKMNEIDCEKVVLVDHPDYNLSLGIENTELEKALGTGNLIPINDFYNRYLKYLGVEDGSDEYYDHWYDHFDVSWEWMRECWKQAKGPESGKTVILFENNAANTIDLTTGKEIDDHSELDLY